MLTQETTCGNSCVLHRFQGRESHSLPLLTRSWVCPAQPCARSLRDLSAVPTYPDPNAERATKLEFLQRLLLEANGSREGHIEYRQNCAVEKKFRIAGLAAEIKPAQALHY